MGWKLLGLLRFFFAKTVKMGNLFQQRNNRQLFQSRKLGRLLMLNNITALD